MPGESPAAEPAKALVGTGITVASALFLAAGFLAARAYLGTLGLPENIVIPVDGYIQYGGRFFVVLVTWLFPAVLFLTILFVLAAPVAGGMKRFPGDLHLSLGICLVVVGAELVAIVLELLSLRPDPVFLPGRVRDVPPGLRLQLYAVEAMVVITVVLLAWNFTRLRFEMAATFRRKGLFALALLLALTEVLLLPLCFGQIAMIPSSFDRVTLLRDKGEPPFTGILIFSDNSNYFLYAPDRTIVQIGHSTVKEVHYEGRQPLGMLVTR